MKINGLIATLLAAATFMQCATRSKIAYNIPPDLPESKKEQLLAIIDKGKKLYKINCAQCHGIFTAGKDDIPNFTNTQLDNYTSRYLKKDLKNHAVITQMSPDQLNQVLTFLKFRKISGPPATHVAADTTTTLQKN